VQINLEKRSDYLALLLGQSERIQLSSSDDPAEVVAGLRAGAPGERKTVLLLGSNGFVGMHLLHELLVREEVGRVIALVRPTAEMSGRERIDDRAQHLRMSLPNLGRLEVLEGAFTRPQMGLSAPAYTELVEVVDVVINAAGSTDHSLPYAYYRRETILPMFRLLEFCLTGRLKALHIIGSVGCEVYTQWRDFLRVGFFNCGYSRMKWVTKHIVRQLHGRSVPIHMYLPSFVLGSRHTAYRDPGMQYSFWQMLWYAGQIGKMWDCGDKPIPVVSGDVLARCVLDNVLAGEPAPLVYPAQPLHSQEVAELFGWEHIPWEEFRSALQRRFSLRPARWAWSHPVSSLLEAVRHLMYTRTLFPKHLPQIIKSISEASEASFATTRSDVPLLQVVGMCAENNYMFKRMLKEKAP